MAENRDDKIVYAIYASTNFYTGMACLAMEEERAASKKIRLRWADGLRGTFEMLNPISIFAKKLLILLSK